LSRDLAPGVDDDTLQFATIVTPDADPKARDGMLAVMQQFFSDKNEFIRGGHRPIKSTQRIEYRVTRRWQLHVWQLEGAPESWQKQLERHLAREPVFAVISGIGGADWSPVQRFCEQAKVPCLFPNVDLPVRDDSDFYSVYFSRGVLLDAALLAQTLQERVGASSPGRIVQVFREGDVGRAAARALGADPRLGGAQFVERSVPARGAAALKEALADLRDGDALVLWLRAADLAALPTPIPTHVSVYASGTMGGLENAPLAGEWRAVTRLVYPVELPQQRTVAMTFSRRWFKVRGVPVVDERVQTDTYIRARLSRGAHRKHVESPAGERLLPAAQPGPGPALRVEGRLSRTFRRAEGNRARSRVRLDRSLSALQPRSAQNAARSRFRLALSRPKLPRCARTRS
jgi:hypothetical protein